MVKRTDIKSDVIDVCHVLTQIPKPKITEGRKLGRGANGIGMTNGLIELLYEPFTKISKKSDSGKNVTRKECRKLKKKTVKDAIELVFKKAKGE